MSDLPRKLTLEELKENLDDKDSFVVMGALTNCSSGTEIDIQLRTDDIGTEDGYGIKMLNIDVDKEENFADKGVEFNLSSLGNMKANTLLNGGSIPKPDNWYHPCTKCPKCDPDFLEEWFEPSDTVSIVNGDLPLLLDYNKKIKDAKDAIESANNQLKEYLEANVEQLEGKETWFLIGGIIAGPKNERNRFRTQQAEYLEANSSGADITINSRTDGLSNLAQLQTMLNNIKAIDDSATTYLSANGYSSVFSGNNEIDNAQNAINDAADTLKNLTSIDAEEIKNTMDESTADLEQLREQSEGSKVDQTSLDPDEHSTPEERPLIKRSVLICRKGGFVYITDNGQKLSMVDIKIKKMKKEFPGCYHEGLTQRIKENPYIDFEREDKNYTLEERYNAEKSIPKDKRGSKYDGYPKWVYDGNSGDNIYATDEQILNGLDPLTYVNDPDLIFGLYDSYYSQDNGRITAEDIAKIFNSRSYSREENYADFAKELLDKSIHYNVNPIYLLGAGQTESTFLTNPSPLAQVFNFFGIYAYATETGSAYDNGEAFAENHNWNNAKLALVGGEIQEVIDGVPQFDDAGRSKMITVTSSIRYFSEEWGDRPNFYSQRYEDTIEIPSKQYGTAANMASLKGELMANLIKDAELNGKINGTFKIPVYQGACGEKEAAFKGSVRSVEDE